jgi:hypothetical protein
MAHESSASKGTDGGIGRAASNMVEINKRPLIRKAELKKGSGESPKHSRGKVVEFGKPSFFYPILKRDTPKT